MKIKSLRVQNYHGYEDCFFDFTNEKGSINPISILYGPNGCGKSTILRCIDLMGNLQRIRYKNNDVYFRKMIYNEEYLPSYFMYQENNRRLLCEAMFYDGYTDHHNSINTDLIYDDAKSELEKDGIEEISACHAVNYVDADHTINRQNFQINANYKDKFIDLSESIFGYKVELRSKMDDYEFDGKRLEGAGQKFTSYQDVILTKGKTKVHFKSMSDGEKKICTLLKYLCSEKCIDGPDILLVDNIEMHVYFERHERMIDKLLEVFPSKQFIVTTHSKLMIDHVNNLFGTSCLFDIAEMKGQMIDESL